MASFGEKYSQVNFSRLCKMRRLSVSKALLACVDSDVQTNTLGCVQGVSASGNPGLKETLTNSLLHILFMVLQILFEGSDKIFRDFVYIDDAIQANIKACAPKKNGVYNVGTGKPRSFQDIADILQNELGTNYQTEYFPNPYDGYQMHTQADISASKSNLGYGPKVSLEEGISSYIQDIKRLHRTEN